MSDVFPKWTNRLPLMIIVGAILLGTAVTAGCWYYFTNKYTNVGYMPLQPVAFSHSIHADQLGIDCRYCHNAVEKSWYSNIPASSVCMNCHSQVLKDDPKLALVRESYATGQPIPWVQIHKLPDYVYFNHSVHVNRGVSCVECHGQINNMDEVVPCQAAHHDLLPGLPSRPRRASSVRWIKSPTWTGSPPSPEKQRADGHEIRPRLERSNPCKIVRPVTDENHSSTLS